MLRGAITILLALGALYIATTPRGLALFGPARATLAVALGVLIVLQSYRLVSAWQARTRGDRLSKIPKRPLGLDDSAGE